MNKAATCLTIVFLMLMVQHVQYSSSESSSEMDVLRFQTVEGPGGTVPDNTRLAMQTGVIDVYPDLMRTVDVEALDSDGFLITRDVGFHLGFIAHNIYPDQSYRRSVAYWPLADAEFRHALVHCYDQLGIIPPIYGYIVSPIHSLVPPAQSKYYNPAVPTHPYAPGDPFTSTSSVHDSCGILMAAGYTFVDADLSGDVTEADYWKCPGGANIPYMELWTPLVGVAPTSWQHGQEFVADLAEIGLKATMANGNKGWLSVGRDFNDYLSDVYDHCDYDAYMVFYSLGRIPDHLYSFLHSGGHCWEPPCSYWHWRVWSSICDPVIDYLVEIVKFSLDADAIEAAAKQVQEMISDPTLPNADRFALAYMPLYSRSYFNSYNPNLRGIVRSPGYGSDNSWTSMNIHWLEGFERIEDGKETVIWSIVYAPSSLNPCYATTKYEWNILGSALDGGTAVNPYNHYDIPWLAEDWTITATAAGMDMDFTLRSDVEWQDGHSFVASDVEFCLEFMRDYSVPRYAATWATLDDVVVTDATHLTIEANEEGLGLFYDYSGLIALLPPQVWDRTWASDQAVLDYDPTEAYNVAPGYVAGPTPTPTNLFGTGSWIFQFYDEENELADLWKNENCFMTDAEVEGLLEAMFWEVGDYDKSGVVDVVDMVFVSLAYGCIEGFDPCYDADADFNSDGIVDMQDLYSAAFHLLWQKEYP